MKKAIFLYFLVFVTLYVFSQTNNSYSVVGKWNKTKMVDGFKRETNKENEILEIKIDGTYHREIGSSVIEGTWSLNKKVIIFTNSNATYSVKIKKLSPSKLVLFSEDETAKFHSFYIKNK